MWTIRIRCVLLDNKMLRWWCRPGRQRRRKGDAGLGTLGADSQTPPLPSSGALPDFSRSSWGGGRHATGRECWPLRAVLGGRPLGEGQDRQAQRFLALVESDLQSLSLLFCFLCREFRRNQIEPESISTRMSAKLNA